MKESNGGRFIVTEILRQFVRRRGGVLGAAEDACSGAGAVAARPGDRDAGGQRSAWPWPWSGWYRCFRVAGGRTVGSYELPMVPDRESIGRREWRVTPLLNSMRQ